jgi:hypothetical protein
MYQAMSKNVFANGKEISAKKDDNKSTAALPDTCLSPPSPPAGPVPLPYPNTAEASDTTDGSKTVKIGGSEVGLKNTSSYKKSTGDEAATKSLGMGVVSHNIQGKMKHAAWSFDVKIEGANAIRHMDMTTHNHINTDNATPGIDLANEGVFSGDEECVELEEEAMQAVEQDSTVRDDNDRGYLAPGVALVTARASNGNNYIAAQPPDTMNANAANGYSGSHGSGNHPCGGKAYADNSQNNCNHAETKIMHDAVGGGLGAGGSLTLRVNWNNGGDLSHSPCDQCMGSICEVAIECNIQIFICTNHPEGQRREPAPCRQKRHRPGSEDQGPGGRGYSNKWEGGPSWRAHLS